MGFRLDVGALRRRAGLEAQETAQEAPEAPRQALPLNPAPASPARPANAANRLTPLPTVSHLAGLAGVASSDQDRATTTTKAETSARVIRMARMGWHEERAQDAAARLEQRDADGDDRRMCIECTHLGDTGRCVAAALGRVIGADRRLEPVQDMLQRCEAFGLRKGLL